VGTRGKRSDEPLFLVEDYEIDKPLRDLENFERLRNADQPVGQISFEDEQIYEAPTVRAFDRDWQLTLGVVQDRIYKIALFRSSRDRNQARLDMFAVFGVCKSLYGQPTDDDGLIAVWDAEDGNVVVQTNAINPQGEAREYFVHVFLTSRRVRNFRVRSHV